LFGPEGWLNYYVGKLSFMPEKRASPRLNIRHVNQARQNNQIWRIDRQSSLNASSIDLSF
jgi:hypothetical protein